MTIISVAMSFWEAYIQVMIVGHGSLIFMYLILAGVKSYLRNVNIVYNIANIRKHTNIRYVKQTLKYSNACSGDPMFIRNHHGYINLTM